MPKEHEEDLEPEGEEATTSISVKDLRALRNRAKEADKLEPQLAALTKEATFKEAGVDLASPVGKLFFDTFSGELNADAIRVQAEALGAVKATEPPKPPTGDAPPTNQVTDDERKLTDERRDLATGGAPETGQVADPDPKTESVKVAMDLIASGKSESDALAGGIGHIINAAIKGDKRASWEPQSPS